jgi:hypothetical protein
MGGWTSGSASISVFCLSALEDTGWYMVNCSYSEALMFGDYGLLLVLNMRPSEVSLIGPRDRLVSSLCASRDARRGGHVLHLQPSCGWIGEQLAFPAILRPNDGAGMWLPRVL